MEKRVVSLAALGYFIDILDLFLFSVLRVPSLADIGVPSAQHLRSGVYLLNWQMGGLLLGSFLFGVLGDRRGRVKVLYGSLLIYSLATFANAFVASLPAYAACRFVAGLGLAGELGAAITLVSETLPTARRGLGTMLVAGCGLCGGIAAAALAERLPWRICYEIGGGLGLLLLLLRVRLLEPRIFLLALPAPRGSLTLLLGSRRRRALYLRLILVGLPIWFVAGILMVFAPELGRALQVAGPAVTAARAVLYSYFGVALGNFLSSLLSQYLRSRKRAMTLFLLLLLVGIVLYLTAVGVSSRGFYLLCFLLGLATGYWAVLVTTAAEHFGTNLRATVATSVPNLVRAGVIPLGFLFQRLQPALGLRQAALLLGAACVLLALWALAGLQETFTRDLAFLEHPA